MKTVTTKTNKILFYLYGPVRLKHKGKSLKIQRKSLGILSYLAIEKVARRELLADLLWEGTLGSNSLRVELYKLRKMFSKLGFEDFATENLIEFPTFITIVEQSNQGQFLEGLEGLSFSYQEWLETIRAKPKKVNSNFTFVSEKLLQNILEQIQAPYLIFIQGLPGSGRLNFAKEIAISLDLPLLEDSNNQLKAVRVLRAESILDDAYLKRILQDSNSIWLVICSSLQEDTSTLLKLRHAYPPDNTSYLQLTAVPWQEARKKFLSKIPFPEAAQIYHHAGGYLAFLQELLQLRPSNGFGNKLPLLRRLQASYKLEAQRLSRGAYLVLEKLCVHPNNLPEGLLEALSANLYLDELERCGWLVFQNSWRFVNNHVRYMIYQQLKAGQRNYHHTFLAEYFASTENYVASIYHQEQAQNKSLCLTPQHFLTDWQNLILTQSNVKGNLPAIQKITSTTTNLGKQIFPLKTTYFGEGIEVCTPNTNSTNQIFLVRTPLMSYDSGFKCLLKNESYYLHLKGNVYVENTIGLGATKNNVPLQLTLNLFGREKHVYFTRYKQAVKSDIGHILLPLTEYLDYWLIINNAKEIQLHSQAATAIFELQFSFFAKATSKFMEHPQVKAFEV